jgi:beta-mannanase
MNISRVLIFAAGIILLFVLFYLQKLKSSLVKSKDSIDLTFREPVLGMFELRENTKSDIFSHYAWRVDKHVDEVLINDLLAQIPEADHLIITLFMPGFGNDSSPNVLQDITGGDYDAKIEALCDALSKRSGMVYLRWNPEMEVPVRLYPWQYQSPTEYIEAFCHFSRRCKAVFPAVKIVWGPAGYPGADEYWPGADAVDYNSVTLYGKSELQATAFPVENDQEIYVRRKMQRMRISEKPVLVLQSGGGNTEQLKNVVEKAAADTRRDAAYLYSKGGQIAKDESEPKGVPLLGVYDPKEVLVTSGMVGAEHIFVDIASVQSGQFERDFNNIISRQHDAIVSVEPWRDMKVRNDSSVLTNVINGSYDVEFATIYRIVAGSNRTVYLRFAHEMEIPLRRYPWQSQDPVLYIKAFRYFMNFDKSKNKHIRKVWGPAGDRGSMEWWPGGDVVDYISIAIYGLPDKNITDPEKQESFEVIYNRKAYRMRMANKPLFITEFGVKGPEEFQQNWLLAAARVIRAHSEIKGVSYFNLEDNPEVWGDIPAPDWSISKATFKNFVDALSERR